MQRVTLKINNSLITWNLINPSCWVTHSCLTIQEGCAEPQHGHCVKMQRMQSARGLGRLSQALLAPQLSETPAVVLKRLGQDGSASDNGIRQNATLQPRNMPV